VTTWSDAQIQPGAGWREEIEAAIGRAGVAVMLVSENFLASPFCTDEELPRFIKERAGRGLKVISVLLADCYWEAVPFLADHQMLPRDENNSLKAIKSTGNKNRAWKSVVKAIDEVLNGGAS
jgi:hypothetical protein